MRVGEILLEHGWIDAQSVQRAAAEQRLTGKRICSLLIARGLLDADHAARALGQQHDVAAAMQRHLENRDRTVASLLTPSIARACVALPIGRNRDGELIICVRDPKPQLHAYLVQAVAEPIVIAVAPATQLEHLIDISYEPSASEEYDVDLNTGPIPTLDDDPGLSMPDLGSLTLVELDDSRVSKDHSQSSLLARPLTIPPFTSVTPVASKRTLDETLAAIAGASTRDVATDAAMRFAHGRWVAALLLAIREGAALGHRGHGTALSLDAVQAVAIPLTSPSIIKSAHDARRVAGEPLSGAIQDRLARLLGQPRAPLAAPILVGGRVACVLAVGDSLAGGDSPGDLERLATALGDAYTRLLLRDKKG